MISDQRAISMARQVHFNSYPPNQKMQELNSALKLIFHAPAGKKHSSPYALVIVCIK
jgi:hypothetical protein